MWSVRRSRSGAQRRDARRHPCGLHRITQNGNLRLLEKCPFLVGQLQGWTPQHLHLLIERLGLDLQAGEFGLEQFPGGVPPRLVLQLAHNDAPQDSVLLGETLGLLVGGPFVLDLGKLVGVLVELFMQFGDRRGGTVVLVAAAGELILE